MFPCLVPVIGDNGARRISTHRISGDLIYEESILSGRMIEARDGVAIQGLDNNVGHSDVANLDCRLYN